MKPTPKPLPPSKSPDFNELFLIKYVNTLFNGDLTLNLNFDDKVFDESSFKQAFKNYLHYFLDDLDSKNICTSCLKTLESHESRFFNFKTENFIKKIKDCFSEIKNFRENFFKILEKFVAADLKIMENTSESNRISLMHLEIMKNNIEESNKKIVELKEDILFLILHPAEKNAFFQIDESFPFQEYQSKLKENLFLDTKFSFDFERILGQITEFKNGILQINSPKKMKEPVLKKEDIRNSQGKKNQKNDEIIKKEDKFNKNDELNNKKDEKNNNKKDEILNKKEENSNKKEVNSAKKDEASNKKEEKNNKKEENLKQFEESSKKPERSDENLAKKADENAKKPWEKPRTISSPRDAVPLKKPSKDIRKYLTPKKDRMKNSKIFIDDTFVDPQKETENETNNLEKNTMLIPNHKSLSARNADNKVIMFMVGNEKWSRLNTANSEKKPIKKTNKINSTVKKPMKNAFGVKRSDKESKNHKNSDLFQEKISEILCVAGETSECMTPVKLLRELAQLKNLCLEKSLTSDFGSKESFILKGTEDEKNLIKMSNKLKEKFKQDYNLDIDLIEKESRNSAMQTPSFGANNTLQMLKHAKNNGEKIQTNLEKMHNNAEKGKKMEQINEICSPKDEKYGHFEFVEKVYQPVLKKISKK